MRSAIHTTFGEPADVLALEESPVPEPGPGQVRIKTILSPIHNHDLWTVRGSYGYKPELPAIGGSEAVGTVDALGEGVTGIVLLAESHASVHTWPEAGLVTLDVFTCGALDARAIVDRIRDALAPVVRERLTAVARGDVFHRLREHADPLVRVPLPRHLRAAVRARRVAVPAEVVPWPSGGRLQRPGVPLALDQIN